MADSTEPEPSGALFQGLKFWFSSRVKGKIGLRNQVEVSETSLLLRGESNNWQANGGIVLQLEKGADIKIVNPEQQQSMPGRCVVYPTYLIPARLITVYLVIRLCS